MTGGAVLRAASAGVTRRLVPTVVIFLVLTAGSAAALLGLTLVTNSNELFLTAFTRAHGAQLAVTADTAKATPAQLARARELQGVTQAAGPYPQTYLKLRPAHDAEGDVNAVEDFVPMRHRLRAEEFVENSGQLRHVLRQLQHVGQLEFSSWRRFLGHSSPFIGSVGWA